MDNKFLKIEHRKGANPFEVFNQKFNPVHICRGSKNFEPAAKGKNILLKGGDVAFEWNEKKEHYYTVINDDGWQKGELHSPFKLLTKIAHGNKWKSAMLFTQTEYMAHNIPYVRIGTDYYKEVTKRNRWGIDCTELKVWTKEAIKQDHKRRVLDEVVLFDDYTIIPDNKNYEPVVDEMYNLYEPFPHKSYPKDVTISDIPVSATFMAHIFGEQEQAGWEYMKLLYEQPQQILPVLVLTSKERQTGKTSFMDWLDIIYANNFTKISPNDLDNSFNSHYAYKNIIGIDEAVVDKKPAIEKVKSLATARKIMVNTKMINQYQLPFYGKIVMATNNEIDFMRVDMEEIRFWVRKVREIPNEHKEDSFLKKLIGEVPKFLAYLEQNIELSPCESRMWFSAERIANDQLGIVKDEGRSGLHKDIELRVKEWFDDNPTQDRLYMRLMDFMTHWYEHSNNTERPYLKKVLENELNKEMKPNSRYYFHGGDIKKKGTPYEFLRSEYINEEELNKNLGETKDENDVPF